MNKLSKIINDLNNLIDDNIEKLLFPTINGNSVRIKNIIVRPSKKHGFVLVDTVSNKTIKTTFSKSAAIASAIAQQKNQSTKMIDYYDQVLEKNVNDCFFYENILKNSNEEERISSTLVRFEDSKHKIYWAKSSLDEFILNDIR